MSYLFNLLLIHHIVKYILTPIYLLKITNLLILYNLLFLFKQKNKKTLNICETCAKCQAICNRINFEKCDKCKNCTDCLKYCDRYYASKQYRAQITVNGKQISIASGKTKSRTIALKKEKEAQILTKTYIENNDIFLLPLIKKIDEEKFNTGLIKETTIARVENNSSYFKP